MSDPRADLGLSDGSVAAGMPAQLPVMDGTSSRLMRRNSDGALEDDLARFSISNNYSDGPSGIDEPVSIAYASRSSLAVPLTDTFCFSRRFYADSIRRDLGSPGVPPQFNGSFLDDDDSFGMYVPQAPGGGPARQQQQQQQQASGDKPNMGRRDSIGALDLAPLAQTRHGARSQMRGEMPAWDAMRQAQHPSAPFDAGQHQQRYQSPVLQQQQQQQQHAMFMRMQQQGAVDPYARPVYATEQDYTQMLAPVSMHGGFPHSTSPSSYADEWLPEATSPVMRRPLPKSVSVPSNLTDAGDAPQQQQHAQHGMRGGWDSHGYAAGRQMGGACRYCKNVGCTRGERCRYNSLAPPQGQMGAYNGGGGGSLRHSPDPSGHDGARDKAGSRSNSKSPGGQHGGKSGGGMHKRAPSEGTRFPPLEQLQGQIYPLCRDQHGCRHLQKKLEEGDPAHIEIIFNEIYDHILELMSDPFGNYLCQKLFAHCTDEQKVTITRKAAPGLVAVSLNMHGTRSVQKLIDCLNTDEQVQIIVEALRGSVVPLIKDLNGNHVIQKCLNRLRAEQNQFIYDAVTQNCVAVASHRHGCCVLQRCIDHANEAQKIQLATEITYNALTLVQDAFGNYVVQYILDLKNPRFSDALIRRFLGHVYELSLQKFSSNVIEKCIRVAELDTRRGLISGLLDKERLPHLLQDSFANYVVQTSLDVSEPEQHAALVEIIRPILPSIRHLPYCKRIQSKLSRDVAQPRDGMAPPNGMMMGSPPSQQQQQAPMMMMGMHPQQAQQQQAMHMGGMQQVLLPYPMQQAQQQAQQQAAFGIPGHMMAPQYMRAPMHAMNGQQMQQAQQAHMYAAMHSPSTGATE